MELIKRLVAGLAMLCVVGQAFAEASKTIYRTVDESGAVSFSDTPPAGDVPAETLTIDVPAPVDPEGYQQNLEAMRETTDRMAEDRRERETHRASLRQLAAAETSPVPAAPSTLVERYNTGWYGSYGGGHRYPVGRPPWRPGYHPRPEHPVYRPPVRPVTAHPIGNNSQLMRPILSRGE